MARQIEGPWFRVSKGTWYATVEGKSISLGVKGKDSEADAKRAWHRLMAEEPKPKLKAIAAKPEVLSVQAVANAFLADGRTRFKPSTMTTYEHALGEFCSTFGKRDADTLTAQSITLWLTGLKVNSSSKSIRLRAVSACFGWAVKHDLMANNPILKVAKPKSLSRSNAVISEADHQKLLKAATKGFRMVLQVLHATGCRPGEAAKFAVENFDPQNGVVKLVEHKNDSTGKPRLIFLPAELVELLKGQAERFKTGALLRNKYGMAWTSYGITQAMMALGKKVGVKGIAYGYRHTFATTALANGVPDAHVASLLGHSSTTMLHKHYSHLTSQATVLRDSLAKVHG